MGMNEADTRYHLIDPVLRDKGYVIRDRITLETVLTPPPVEPSGPKGCRRKGPGRTDYLLCVQVGDVQKSMPVAVLEAKKEADDPLKGMQQARVKLKEQFKRLKKDKAAADVLEAHEAEIRDKEKAARELESQAAAIDAAVFDLKAINPNAVAAADERTPAEIIASIEAQGRIVTQALGRLNALLRTDALAEDAQQEGQA